jgi:predicted oxidoreductase
MSREPVDSIHPTAEARELSLTNHYCKEPIPTARTSRRLLRGERLQRSADTKKLVLTQRN